MDGEAVGKQAVEKVKDNINSSAEALCVYCGNEYGSPKDFIILELLKHHSVKIFHTSVKIAPNDHFKTKHVFPLHGHPCRVTVINNYPGIALYYNLILSMIIQDRVLSRYIRDFALAPAFASLFQQPVPA